jgi:predicted outer membrane repeat protein
MKHSATVFTTFVILLFIGSSLSAKTWYIKPDGSGDAPTIQAGIDSSSIGDTVLLACGTYYDCTHMSPDGILNCVIMKSGVVLLSESNDPGCVTISAQFMGRVFYCDGLSDDTVIQGISIFRGSNLSGADREGGGAFCCNGASPEFNNCHFVDNAAFYGGGIYCTGASPAFISCTFAGNWAFYTGGGIKGSPSLVENCVFEGNGALLGGGLYGHLEATACLFAGNSAVHGGALYGGGEMVDCTFQDNEARPDGSRRKLMQEQEYLDILQSGASGGAVYATGDVNATGSDFEDNHAQYGGALYGFGNTNLSNCLLDHNASATGGVIYQESGVLSLDHCTLHNNTIAAGPGGIIALLNASLGMNNTIVAFSKNCYDFNCTAVYCEGDCDADLHCCDIFEIAGGNWVGPIEGQQNINGNLCDDPMFCDPQSGDFTLHASSPCIPNNSQDCGLIGARPLGCGMISVAFDLVPRSCPNPFNITWMKQIDDEHGNDESKPNKGGIMPAVIPGSAEFDVTEIDPASLLLEGIQPIRSSLEDVTAPPGEGEECACTTSGPDGFMDLTLKFSRQEIAEILGPVRPGMVVMLTLRGSMSDATEFEGSDCLTIIGPREELPVHDEEDAVVLNAPQPNPFNPTTRISYKIPREQFVRIAIYDVTGRLIDCLVDTLQPAGDHMVRWDAGRNASGIYFCRLETAGEAQTRKIVLLK